VDVDQDLCRGRVVVEQPMLNNTNQPQTLNAHKQRKKKTNKQQAQTLTLKPRSVRMSIRICRGRVVAAHPTTQTNLTDPKRTNKERTEKNKQGKHKPYTLEPPVWRMSSGSARGRVVVGCILNNTNQLSNPCKQRKQEKTNKT
jgi:hypothetical protein